MQQTNKADPTPGMRLSRHPRIVVCQRFIEFPDGRGADDMVRKAQATLLFGRTQKSRVGTGPTRPFKPVAYL
jgi:hypothetical protein